ncbi:MAG: heavy metal-binding domain-containing protein [Acidobacteriota bacterium]
MQQPNDLDGSGRGTVAAAIDPVCGMTVDPRSAAGSYEYKGTLYYFCSTHCLHKFHQDPEGILNKPTELMTAPPIGIGRAKPKQVNHSPGKSEIYTCPMHPEVRENKPGSCPRCGMALEPLTVSTLQTKTEYTCPMHPEIVRDAPGSCPICGMALEPRTVSLGEDENPELRDMRQRFLLSAVLSVPVFALGMSDLIPGEPLQQVVSMRALAWVQLALASPVVLWGGWPFLVRAWQSLVNRSLNMFTLIGLGVTVAYLYSVVATVFPDVFPHSFREHDGGVAVYVDADLRSKSDPRKHTK